MTGVLSGLRVIDVSRGIAGPMTTMLMADHGAHVTRVVLPEPDPFEHRPGYRVWQRGKTVTRLDLADAADRAAFLRLSDEADVLVESFAPGQTASLGIDYETLKARNPGLIYLSITGYGRDTADAARPAIDALVAARTGLQWEQRGWPEGTEFHMVREEGFAPDVEVPYHWVQGPARPGPVFPASAWPSLGAFFAASLGVSAALLSRQRSGRGQHVETSLLQGALAAAWAVWQRAEHPDTPGYPSWIFGSRSPKGHFRCADGRWIHQWVPNPRFLIGASEQGETGKLSLHEDPDRFGIGPEELLVMMHYQEDLVERVGRFPAQYWIDAAAPANVPLQDCRSVEEALVDPALLADGCVVEIDDPEEGPLRQVGQVYRLGACSTEITGAPPAQPDARFFAPAREDTPAVPRGGPLAGTRVLDLGMAIAGPYGTQLLSDLGADVIKINTLYDSYWHESAIAFSANRGKRSLAINLKDPRARDIVRRLVERCDVVQHNMRYSAAVRLGLDYDSLKAINPALVYCHSRGFERGPREGLPGNDQTGAALAGIQYEDGAVANGGKPMWSLTSFGDTGNGFLSAIAIVQALMHRDRTGEGQFIDTSIINACLLNTSYAYARPDGSGPERERIDRDQLGYSALHRLYETADGWLCVAALRDQDWTALGRVRGLESVAVDARFATAESRRRHDAELAGVLARALLSDTAVQWRDRLDAEGVPAEVSDPGYPLRLHEDSELLRRGWVVGFDDQSVGQLHQPGLCVDLSETPGRVQGPPLVVGDCSVEILKEIGLDPSAIAALVADGVVITSGSSVSKDIFFKATGRS